VRARNIILMGYRGCGKSSVARELAVRLGWRAVDTDERVQSATGRSIRAIFEQDGEASFRQWEARMIEESVRSSQQVISVGGGAVVQGANRAALRGAGVCFWLTAPPEELQRRMQGDPNDAATRPALTAHGSLDEIRHLLGQREPLYAALADHVVDTSGRSIAQVVDAILSLLAPSTPGSERV
jgi:shikimate kinase